MKNILPLLVATFFLITTLFTNAQNMALDFNGSADYIETNYATDLATWTIECWVKGDADASTSTTIQRVIDRGNNFAINWGHIESGYRGTVQIYISGSFHSASFGTLEANVWYHLAATYDGEDLIAYKNGVLMQTNGNPTGSANTTSDNLGIGAVSNGDGKFPGQIDEVRIWSSVRTQAEIRANMYLELAGTETGLVAYYKLNETSSTTAYDSQTSGTYDGTLYGGFDFAANALPSPAFFGPKSCLDFDGLDANVWCPSITPTVTSGTIEFWVNLDVLPADNARLISRGANYLSGDEIYLLNNITGGINSGKIYTAGFVAGDDLISTDPLPTDVWTHVAITADGSGSKLYINGILDDTGGAATWSFNTFRFGGQFTAGFYEGIDGMMDEVRLWSNVRTESEIRENMYKSLVGDESGLVAYFNLDNASGAVAQSYPAEANDGSIGGGATWVASTAFNTWLNTNSSDLATASNWSNGIPTATDNVGINNYSGVSPILIGNPTVNNLFIGSGTGITLNSGFTVNGNLLLNDNLDLNGQTITLGSTATLYEDNGLISGSTGSITTTRNLNNINKNVAGLGAIITTTADMGNTVISRGHTVYVTEGNNSIKRYFDITPTNNTGLNATLTFNYDDSELNGLTESSLNLFKSTDGGTIWTNESGTVNTTNNTISLSGIDGFSRWTAAEDLVLSLENNVIEGFSMYPNPTKDLLFINATEEIKQVKIFNLLGQQLVDKSINSKDSILDLKLLPTGTYYLLIYTHNTIKSVKLLIE